MRWPGFIPERTALTSQSGQTTVEYILILAVIVGIFVTFSAALRSSGVGRAMGAALFKEFKATYELGHPEAKSYDDGPEKHPRIPEGDNFRLFINPGTGG